MKEIFKGKNWGLFLVEFDRADQPLPVVGRCQFVTIVNI